MPLACTLHSWLSHPCNTLLLFLFLANGCGVLAIPLSAGFMLSMFTSINAGSQNAEHVREC